MSTSHTHGPWEMGRTDIRSFTFCPESEETELVQYVYRGEEFRIPVFGSNCVEDARLIASAPDLLSACKQVDFLTMAVEIPDEYRGAIKQMRAAIAKAEGTEGSSE